jgi:DNA-binding IclR family transcriptional regulator
MTNDQKEKGKNSPVAVGKRSGAQSLHRAISLIRAVARHNDSGFTLSKLAREAGLHVATAHRMLSVLAKENLVFQDPASRHYHLGIDLFLLAGAAQQFTIRHRFRTALERIAQETGDTVFLLIRSGYDALCLDRVEGQFPIRTVPIDIGVRRPLGIGAGSLALIGFLAPEQLEPILQANARRYPQYKSLNKKDIQEMAAHSRKTGYVVSEGLFHPGVTSIGIPIFHENGEVIAAITVSSVSQRMEDKRRGEIFRLVKEVLRKEGIGFPMDASDLRRTKNPGRFRQLSSTKQETT